jgi:hypothetical protein
MPYSIDIVGLTGGTGPLDFYACDEYGNNCTLLGNSNTGYNPILPPLLQEATTVMFKIVDATGCIKFKLISCEPDTYIILTEIGDFLTTEDGDTLVFF